MLAYVDTSIIIPIVEDFGVYKNRLEIEIAKLKQSGWDFCISQAVILETLCKPFRDRDFGLIRIYHRSFSTIKVLPDYANLLRDSIYIMQIEKLKAMDSIHVSLAKHYGCEGFVTTDPHFQNLTTIQPLWIDLASL